MERENKERRKKTIFIFIWKAWNASFERKSETIAAWEEIVRWVTALTYFWGEILQLFAKINDLLVYEVKLMEEKSWF